MLSVAEGARQLGVSPARVRALIKDGLLPARKIGREWVLQEEDVLQRLAEQPRPGRPRLGGANTKGLEQSSDTIDKEARMLFDACKRLFDHMPSDKLMSQARSQEEASFYMAIADFFLQQKQAELIAQGVF